MKNPWNEYALPVLLDKACSLKPMMRQREIIVPQANGVTLEIGIGTGLNLAYYQQDKITKLYGLDPELQMHRLAKQRQQKANIDLELLSLPAEQIPLDDASCDTVLTTFTLCTIPDVDKALSEMRRVLKPGGKLLFCEHGKAPDANVLRWQTRFQPLWKKLAGGCHLNRAIPDLLTDAGFNVDSLEQQYLKGPKPWTYVYWGAANK